MSVTAFVLLAIIFDPHISPPLRIRPPQTGSSKKAQIGPGLIGGEIRYSAFGSQKGIFICEPLMHFELNSHEAKILQ